jgi:hypothetical protein
MRISMGELEEKIKKELLKSGFPLQIYCQRCLLENDWDILVASEYFISDRDTKEIDVIGYYKDELDDKTSISYELIIECKKNEDNPWVFFKDDNPTPNSILSSYICAAPRNWPDPFYAQGLHFEKLPSSSIYTMAFKKKSKNNQIYEAISKVILAYNLRQEFLEKIWQDEERGENTYSTITISFLNVLFDGKLYLANLEESGTLQLAETTSLVYCHKETKATRCFYYSVDIVNRDYFSDYLKLLDRDRNLISKFYKKKLKIRA